MANLQSTTSPEISATNISSPRAYNTGSMAMLEYTGSSSIALNGTVDLITNNSGYLRSTGVCYFVCVPTSGSNSYGYFSFTVSRYGVTSTNLLSTSGWGSYSVENYQDPGNVDINSLRFRNTYTAGTFYFAVVVQNQPTFTSSVLTRIK